MVIKSESDRVKLEVASFGRDDEQENRLGSLIRNNQGFDYIIHSACPFIANESEQDAEKIINEYVGSTAQMVNEALEGSNGGVTKKIVLTGAASSIVG